MEPYSIPGVYHEEIKAPPRRPFGTGVPAFIGSMTLRKPATLKEPDVPTPTPIVTWPQFAALFRTDDRSYTPSAVRGFFQNGGSLCYVLQLNDSKDMLDALDEALRQLDTLEDVDLLCLPDVTLTRKTGIDTALKLQQRAIEWCDNGNERFVILDSLTEDGTVDAAVKQWSDLEGSNAALYYPWLKVASLTSAGQDRAVPPCGHIAGVFASTDRERGFFHAPANKQLEGVHDLTTLLTDSEQKACDSSGVVNCMRVFPGRGIRLWGGRTINGQTAWRYVNVRRLFLTFHRWLNEVMSSLVFEPNTAVLWARIRRTVIGYLEDLHRRGGLAGASPEQAFFVRCDGRTTPAYLRDSGRVVAEIGMAPVLPSEFVIVRIVLGAGELIIGDADAAPGEE